jgi:hypothetical protein
MDRLIKVHGNSLVQQTLGLNGDATFLIFRLIPIEQEQNINNPDEFHYRMTLVYFYLSKLDKDENIKVDNNNPASVIDHIKYMIRKLRPECEMTNVFLELWDLAPRDPPNDSVNYPYKNYNPIQKRQIRDIYPLSNPWTTSRVTLAGDAAHAMSPILGLGTNNALQDADILSQALLNYSPENYISCIKEYENKMLKRSSADVLSSRAETLAYVSQLGYFGSIIRDTKQKTKNTIINVYNSIKCYILGFFSKSY